MSIIYKPAGRAAEYAEYAANLYSGCSHKCKYCYAPAALRRSKEEFHATPKPRTKILESLEADCKKMNPRSVLFSFTTDPYQPIEEECGVTRQGIQILKKYGFAVEILTKGGIRAAKDFDLLDERDAFATTLTFLNKTDSLEWEPDAAEPQERIEAMKIAHARGIKVWASLEPVIDPEQSLEIIRQTHSFVDLFKVGKLNHHPLASTINWHNFGHRAKKLLEELGKNYYLKHDLRLQM